MSLLDAMEAQTRRIRSFTRREERQAINVAAQPCVTAARSLLARCQRLRLLTSLPREIVGEMDLHRKKAETSLRDVTEKWRDLELRDVSSQVIITFQGVLQQADTTLGQVIGDVERTGKERVQTFETRLHDTAFLARELGVDSMEMEAARVALLDRLATIRAVLERQMASAPDDWPRVYGQYDQMASPRACLRQAQLPPEVGELVAALLEQGELPLALADPHALLGLAQSPSLARLCRIVVAREERS